MKLTRYQIRSIRRLVRVMREMVGSSTEPALSVVRDMKVETLFKKKVAVAFNVERTDCDKYSPRGIFCNDGVHAFVGPKGSVEIVSARRLTHGDTTEERRANELRHLKNIAIMARAKVSSIAPRY